MKNKVAQPFYAIVSYGTPKSVTNSLQTFQITTWKACRMMAALHLGVETHKLPELEVAITGSSRQYFRELGSDCEVSVTIGVNCETINQHEITKLFKMKAETQRLNKLV